MTTFDHAIINTLETYGFDAGAFARNRARLRAREDVFASNIVTGDVTPPGPDDLHRLPERGGRAWEQLHDRGARAIAEGQVGVVVLCGGMATRFGGGVKATVEVTRGRSFLDLKLADVARCVHNSGGTVPVVLLASFATAREVVAAGERASTRTMPVTTLTQFVSVRLLPEGDIAVDDDDRPSLYAPGHGDLTFALRASGTLRRFRDDGGKLLLLSNVDNVAATLDPAIIGAHLAAERPVTVEVVRKQPGDAGGAPARVNGALQIVEGFRFPAHFDQTSIPVFNTNTFVLDAAAIDRDFPLTWFAVSKRAHGQDVVQFERLVGELTAFLPTHVVEVPRHGPDSRFQPVKDPGDLIARRPEIDSLLAARGVF